MDVPIPVPGLVVRYAYLWASEYDTFREESVKDRPAVVILAERNTIGRLIVVVLSITQPTARVRRRCSGSSVGDQAPFAA